MSALCSDIPLENRLRKYVWVGMSCALKSCARIGSTTVRVGEYSAVGAAIDGNPNRG